MATISPTLIQKYAEVLGKSGNINTSNNNKYNFWPPIFSYNNPSTQTNATIQVLKLGLEPMKTKFLKF